MGSDETPYMQWAAGQSAPQLKDEINSVIHAISKGKAADRSKWPARAILTKYLANPDEVILIMAAQMIALGEKDTLDNLPMRLRQKVVSKLKRSEDLFWRKNLC